MDASLIASTVADDGLSVAGTLSSTQTLDKEIEVRDTLVSLLLSPSLVPRTIALPIMTDEEQGYATHERKDSSDRATESLKRQIQWLTEENELFKKQKKRYKKQKKRYKKQNEELTTENEELMTENEELTSKIEGWRNHSEKLMTENEKLKSQIEGMALKRKRKVDESESRGQKKNKASPDSGGDNSKPAQVGSPAQNDTHHLNSKDSRDESKFQDRSLLDSSSDSSGGNTTCAQIGSNTPAQNVHQLDLSGSPSFGDGNEMSIPTPSTEACNDSMNQYHQDMGKDGKNLFSAVMKGDVEETVASAIAFAKQAKNDPSMEH